MKQLRPYQQQAIQETWEALKKDDAPVLLMASVGAGKSLMLARILLKMQNAGKRALCLVNNAELVRSNAEAFVNEGGKASIYCAALGEKSTKESVIFGTPQSILNAINKDESIGKIGFNIIIVDEAHNINHLNIRSCFMRILRHYKHLYQDMRVLGATGTNFRFKGTSIVGDGCLFKTQVGNITTEQLIADEYLIKPIFEVDQNLILDFSQVKVKKNGQFDQRELEGVIEKSARLTELICKQVVHVMETQQRRGVFIFATTKKHAFEILSHLPPDESAIILGETPQDERTKILDKSRRGEIRYLVNIAIISVGVDVPSYDTIAYLRPTESLVLLVQTMGRALRLSEATNKTTALVLDFAGNIERHRDWDNPLLLDALKQTSDKDKPLVILCPECQEMNTEHARRCVGKKEDEERCKYYFEFRDCPECGIKNDITSRYCRECKCEIIDPNAKLSLVKSANQMEVDVLDMRCFVSGTNQSFKIECRYYCQSPDRSGWIKETFMPKSPRALNMFYGQFVKKHCKEAGKWYPYLSSRDGVGEVLAHARIPQRLLVVDAMDGIKIKQKYFAE